MTDLIVRLEAAADAVEAVAYFEEQAPGLGGEFVDQLDEALSRIASHPHAYQVLHRGVRRHLEVAKSAAVIAQETRWS